jgi:spermidine/putrescine-binding protein
MNRRFLAASAVLLALIAGGAALAAADAPKAEPAQKPTLQVTYYYLPG